VNIELESIFCLYCKELMHDYTTIRTGPHLKASCNQCGRFLKFIKSKTNAEFLMPFGKYKGKSISEIIEKHPEYVRWLMQQKEFSVNIKKRFEAYL